MGGEGREAGYRARVGELHEHHQSIRPPEEPRRGRARWAGPCGRQQLPVLVAGNDRWGAVEVLLGGLSPMPRALEKR